MSVSTCNPLLFLTEQSKAIYDELATDVAEDLSPYDVSTITNEEITILVEVVEEFWIYFEDENSPDVLKYNMRLLGKKVENLQEDAKANNWDSQKTKQVFQEYEKEMKKIQKRVKKGESEKPENDKSGALQDDVTELEKKFHQTRSSCVII